MTTRLLFYRFTTLEYTWNILLDCTYITLLHLKISKKKSLLKAKIITVKLIKTLLYTKIQFCQIKK